MNLVLSEAGDSIDFIAEQNLFWDNLCELNMQSLATSAMWPRYPPSFKAVHYPDTFWLWNQLFYGNTFAKLTPGTISHD